MRAACVLGALAVFFVLLELGLRVLDPYGISYFSALRAYYDEVAVAVDDPRLSYEHRPNVDTRAGVRVRTNAFGLRGPELEERSPGRPRILFLGDSCTFGMGVEEEDSFVHLLGAELGDRAEVLNGGVVGYNSVQQETWLAKWGPQLDLDAVVLVYVDNDRHFNVDLESHKTRGPALPEELPFTYRLILGWRADLYLRDLAHRQVFIGVQANYPHLVKVLVAPPPDAIQTHEGGWVASLEAVQRIHDWCAERELGFGVLNYNTTANLEVWCAEARIPYHDTGFRELHGAPEYRNSETDAHANRAGNEILAREAGAALAAFGML